MNGWAGGPFPKPRGRDRLFPGWPSGPMLQWAKRKRFAQTLSDLLTPKPQFRALQLDSLAWVCSRCVCCCVVCRFTRDVNVVLFFKDALAHGQFDLQLCGGKAWEVHVQIAHEVRKLPVLRRQSQQTRVTEHAPQTQASPVNEPFRCNRRRSNITELLYAHTTHVCVCVCSKIWLFLMVSVVLVEIRNELLLKFLKHSQSKINQKLITPRP